MIFFQSFKHFWFPLSVRFLLLKSLKVLFLLWEKYRNYALTTTLGDRFASCENIVSRSQTSSLPPPLFHPTIYIENKEKFAHSHLIENKVYSHITVTLI